MCKDRAKSKSDEGKSCNAKDESEPDGKKSSKDGDESDFDKAWVYLSSITIPAPDHPSNIRLTRGGNQWTILQELISVSGSDPVEMAAKRMAKRVARDGFSDKHNQIPSWEVGELYTIDRREIEALRGIRGLIHRYGTNRRMTKPLNLAVFGPPGSGKTYAVEQLAGSIFQPSKAGAPDDCGCHDIVIEKKTFDLSQFDSPADLIGALHQVRDIGLSGKLPLIFWNEFDAKLRDQPLGWLRYFLAPMNEGKFIEGPVTHSIGHCIFVFAGGVYARRAHLAEVIKDDEPFARRVKIPDFISRLHGYLDVFGINPKDDETVTAPIYLIRRANLLRSYLFESGAHFFPEAKPASEHVHGRDRKGSLKIDDGVLRAFLETKEYRSGSRSMRAIVTMSEVGDHRCFDRSCLPSRQVLNLHVNADEFEGILFSNLNGQGPEMG